MDINLPPRRLLLLLITLSQYDTGAGLAKVDDFFVGRRHACLVQEVEVVEAGDDPVDICVSIVGTTAWFRSFGKRYRRWQSFETAYECKCQ